MNKLLFALLMSISGSVFAASLPNTYVEGLNFNQTQFDKVLTKVVAGTGVEVKVNPKVNYTITTKNMSGYIGDVVDHLAKKADVVYTFDGKILYIDEKSKPLSELPIILPVDNAKEAVVVQPITTTQQQPVIKDVKEQVKQSTVEKLDAVKPIEVVKPVQIEPVKVAPVIKDVGPTPDFLVKKGQLASYSLKDYLDKAGYKLYWNASQDIEIAKSESFFGDVEGVTDQFLKSNGLVGWVVDGEKAIFVK